MASIRRDQLEPAILAARDGGELSRAVTLMIEGFGPEVHAFLVGITKDLHEADEVFSLVCEDLWRGLPAFEPRAPLRTWVYAVARNALRRHQRGEQRHRKRAVPLSEAGALSALIERVRTSHRTRARSQLREQIALLRRKLSKEDQILLILRVDRRMEWSDVARVISDEPLDDDQALSRESARLRQRFQAVKDKLRALAAEAGIELTK